MRKYRDWPIASTVMSRASSCWASGSRRARSPRASRPARLIQVHAGVYAVGHVPSQRAGPGPRCRARLRRGRGPQPRVRAGAVRPARVAGHAAGHGSARRGDGPGSSPTAARRSTGTCGPATAFAPPPPCARSSTSRPTARTASSRASSTTPAWPSSSTKPSSPSSLHRCPRAQRLIDPQPERHPLHARGRLRALAHSAPPPDAAVNAILNGYEVDALYPDAAPHHRARQLDVSPQPPQLHQRPPPRCRTPRTAASTRSATRGEQLDRRGGRNACARRLSRSSACARPAGSRRGWPPARRRRRAAPSSRSA